MPATKTESHKLAVVFRRQWCKFTGTLNLDYWTNCFQMRTAVYLGWACHVWSGSWGRKFTNRLDIDLAAFAECVRSGGFAAVGETGLCSKWMKEKENPVRLHLQQKLLHFHILVCKASGLPLILHLRSNEDLDCLRTTSNMMEKEGLPYNHPMMIHCYKGQLEEANAWMTK